MPDLIITPPTATGSPTPTVTFALTRDGADVLGEVSNGQIIDAAPGVYSATWTATNGVEPDATVTRTATIEAASSLIKLTDPASIDLFTVESRTATALQLSRTSGRSYFSFNTPLPIGSRIRFDAVSSDDVWCRLADDATLSNNVTDVFIARSGTFSVDYTTTVSKPWFGFLVGSFVPASTVSITNFNIEGSAPQVQTLMAEDGFTIIQEV